MFWRVEILAHARVADSKNFVQARTLACFQALRRELIDPKGLRAELDRRRRPGSAKFLEAPAHFFGARLGSSQLGSVLAGLIHNTLQIDSAVFASVA